MSLERKYLKQRLRDFMFSANPDSWGKYYGSQLEEDIINFVEQELTITKPNHETRI